MVISPGERYCFNSWPKDEEAPVYFDVTQSTPETVMGTYYVGTTAKETGFLYNELEDYLENGEAYRVPNELRRDAFAYVLNMLNDEMGKDTSDLTENEKRDVISEFTHAPPQKTWQRIEDYAFKNSSVGDKPLIDFDDDVESDVREFNENVVIEYINTTTPLERFIDTIRNQDTFCGAEQLAEESFVSPTLTEEFAELFTQLGVLVEHTEGETVLYGYSPHFNRFSKIQRMIEAPIDELEDRLEEVEERLSEIEDEAPIDDPNKLQVLGLKEEDDELLELSSEWRRLLKNKPHLEVSIAYKNAFNV